MDRNDDFFRQKRYKIRTMKKYKIGFDMDDVLCDFKKAYDKSYTDIQQFPQADSMFFYDLEPIYDNGIANIDYVKMLIHDGHEVYFLTSPSIPNLACWSGKAYWIKKYFGQDALKKLIITYDKSLLKYSLDILVDDSTKNGQLEFGDKLIQYGSKEYPTMFFIYNKISKWSKEEK